MDGLLFDTERIYYEANQNAANEMGIPFSWEYFQKFVGSSEYALYEDISKICNCEKTARSFILRSEEIAVHRMMNDKIPLKSGVVELLEFLKDEQIKLFIGSNSQRKIIELMLKRTGFYSYFDDYVGVDDVKKGKPAPDIYLKALQKSGVDPSSALVLDDSVSGATAAHRAGIPVIIVPDLESPTEKAVQMALAVHDDLLVTKQYIEDNIKIT